MIIIIFHTEYSITYILYIYEYILKATAYDLYEQQNSTAQ